MFNPSTWSIENVGVSGIYAFTVIMAGVLLLQMYDIFSRRSVQSLSTTWIIYFCGMFVSGVIYAVAFDRQPVLINNLMLTLMHLVIAYGLHRYRGFTRRDWLLVGGLAIALAVMVVSPRKDIWFLAFFPGGVIALGIQIAQVWRERTTGVLNPWLLVVYVTSNIFWALYAFAVGDWTLQVICPTNLLAWVVLFVSWIKFRNSRPALMPLIPHPRKHFVE